MKIKIPFKLISIEKSGFHPICILTINSKKALFVIDTGASHTVMDSNRINLFTEEKDIEQHHHLSTGLGTSTMESKLVKLSSLKIGRHEVKNFRMVLLDLSHVNNTYQNLNHKRIDGILGNDLLKKLGAIVSFPSKTVTFTVKK